MLVGLMFCAAFVAVSFFARERTESHYVLLKSEADSHSWYRAATN
jgi:hypothetical protein